jgi:hypothetical protein
VEEGGVADEHPINGKEWTKLRQRGRNPSAEESVSLSEKSPHMVVLTKSLLVLSSLLSIYTNTTKSRFPRPTPEQSHNFVLSVENIT